MDSEDIATSSPSGSPNDPSCTLGYREGILYRVLGSISIVCCLIIILAITIPLFDKEERNKMSAYNLYLVYLAIPDIIIIIGFILWTMTCGIWKIERVAPPVYASLLANVLVNTVIVYELLKLLVDSKTRRRSTPPSLFKASMQALAVYAVCITLLGIMNFHDDRFGIIGFALFLCAYAYILWVLIRICYGRLLRYNSDTLDRLKVLVVYFFRIIFVNMVTGILFIPAHILNGHFRVSLNVWLMIQIWIGFGLALTKPDVLEYVRRLFACVVRPCSKIGSSLGKNGDRTTTESEPNGTDNPSRDPETGDPNSPGDYNEGDKHEDGSVHTKEETEECDRQEITEVTTTSAK